MSIESISLCEVCRVKTDGKYRTFANVCEACRRFYMRNRDNSEILVCKSGDGKCLSESYSTPSGAAILGKSGNLFRFMCSRCRYDKCLAVSRSRFSTPSPDSNSSNNNNLTTICRSPVQFDYIKMEENLSSLVQSSSFFLREMELTPLRSSKIGPIASHVEAWSQCMVQYEAVIGCLVNFVKSIPGYKDISVHDRCLLFVNSTTPLIIASNWDYTRNNHNKLHPSGFALSRENTEIIAPYFPEMTYVDDEVAYFMSIFNAWRPLAAEMAFLFALLFLKAGVSLNTLQNSQVLEKATWHLQSLFDSYIRKAKMSSDEVLTENTITERLNLVSIIGLFQSVSSRRSEAFSHMMSRCPELVTFNKLFFETLRLRQNRALLADSLDATPASQ